MQCCKDFESFRRRLVKSQTLHVHLSINLMQRAGADQTRRVEVPVHHEGERGGEAQERARRDYRWQRSIGFQSWRQKFLGTNGFSMPSLMTIQIGTFPWKMSLILCCVSPLWAERSIALSYETWGSFIIGIRNVSHVDLKMDISAYFIVKQVNCSLEIFAFLLRQISNHFRLSCVATGLLHIHWKLLLFNC